MRKHSYVIAENKTKKVLSALTNNLLTESMNLELFSSKHVCSISKFKAELGLHHRIQ